MVARLVGCVSTRQQGAVNATFRARKAIGAFVLDEKLAYLRKFGFGILNVLRLALYSMPRAMKQGVQCAANQTQSNPLSPANGSSGLLVCGRSAHYI